MKLNRRKFIALSVSGVPAIGTLGGIANQEQAGRKLVAAVLESTDSKTMKMVGAEMMLKRAGFEVIRLTPQAIREDISVNSMVMNFEDHSEKEEVLDRLANPRYHFATGPDINKIDLLFLGTFANGFQPYHDYMRQYAKHVPAFVQAGGVVVEMSQWGRYSFLHPDFLPDTMRIVRETWSGTDQLVAVDKDHILVRNWLPDFTDKLQFPKQPHRPEQIHDGRRSWESIAAWKGMRLLVGAGGGYKAGGDIPGRAALVEGQHGNGRYIISSMWFDKLFDSNGKEKADPQTIGFAKTFFESLYQYTQDIKRRKAVVVKPTTMAPEPLIGPALGHIDHQEAFIWLRGNKAGTYTLTYWMDGRQQGDSVKMKEQAFAENDYCISWHIQNLKAGTLYHYTITADENVAVGGTECSFRTAPAPDAPSITTLAFGSCVDMNGRFTELWKQVLAHSADGMVLLGDSPYIDSTQMEHQRLKHRTFLKQDGPAFLASKIPFWGTWDDHDFGANDSDGGLHSRVNTRKVFKEYRPLIHYGEAEQGIYTSFRRGPVEVFLLDTRYFARTEPSFADPNKPTLIGNMQWKWLQRGLKASTAPFKILACGMTWDIKLPATSTHADTWGSFVYEREAIFEFLGKEKIKGVLLVGGDIHCTQVMKYATEKQIGYPLYHIVTSPMHERLIRENEKLKHPGMLFSRAEPNTFLKITVNTKVNPWLLSADIINITGQSIYRLVISGE